MEKRDESCQVGAQQEIDNQAQDFIHVESFSILVEKEGVEVREQAILSHHRHFQRYEILHSIISVSLLVH